MRRSLALAYNITAGFSLAVAVAACSTDGATPSSPLATDLVALSLSDKDARFDANGDGDLDDAEKAAKKASDEARKAQEKAEKEALDEMKKDWERYKKYVKNGGSRSEFLRCEPQKREQDTKRIGPKGGTLKIGAHELEIPAGALDQEVLITGTAPTGNVVELQFEPHGLQFKKPVQMTMNYSKCIVPDDMVLGVVYVGNGWRVLQEMPAADQRSLKAIHALTDHFSGYMVSSGRSR